MQKIEDGKIKRKAEEADKCVRKKWRAIKRKETHSYRKETQ